MSYDSKVPLQLKEIQEWFGSIIGRPIDENSRMQPNSPSGRPMKEEAGDYIRPSPYLEPSQRIQIYNQQYWWRLLNALQESFPLVTRLFGNHDFNFSIAVPYLLKHPPNYWTLNVLGDRLPQWVQENYTGSDKQLIYHATLIDWAFSTSFTALQNAPLEPSENIMDLTLHLQPHIHLFELPYDLFSFRIDFLKESPDHWLEHDFPALAKDKQPYNVVLFRSSHNDIYWSEISRAQFGFLKQFQKGASVNKACDWLEQQEDAIVEEASENLQKWLQDWTSQKWLTLN